MILIILVILVISVTGGFILLTASNKKTAANGTTGSSTFECPGNSTYYLNNNLKLDPTSVTGCYCAKNTIWMDGNCISCSAGQQFYDGNCVECPTGTSIDDIGSEHPTYTNCKCPSGKHWFNEACRSCVNSTYQSFNGLGEEDAITGCKCLTLGQNILDELGNCGTCPTGTSITGTGLSHPTYTRCKCLPGQHWFNGACHGCASTTYQSFNGLGQQDTVTGCNCLTLGQNILDEIGTCGTCPTGTSIAGTGLPHPTYTRCKCLPGQHWYNGQCRSCTNTTTQSFNGLGQQDTITGCKCNVSNYTLLSNGICFACPLGTFLGDTGFEHPNFNSCKCPDGKHWFDGQCRICSNYTYQSFNGVGQQDTTTGCSCLTSGQKILDELGTCGTCPTGTSTTGIGLSHPIYTRCKCLSGQHWFDGQCRGCDNTTHQSVSGLGEQDTTTGCKCKTSNYTLLANDTCVMCPTGTFLGATGPAHPTYTSCKCLPGQHWFDGACHSCVNTTTQSFNGAGQQDTVTGCKCLTLGQNILDELGTCGACPTGTSTTGTGLAHPTYTRCKCLAGNHWYNGQCRSCANTTTQSFPGAGERDTTTGCRCNASNFRLDELGNCVACPTGTAPNSVGGSHPEISECKCTSGRHWYNGCKICTNTTHQSLTGLGELDINSGCKCNIANYTLSTNGVCVECPTGTNIGGEGKSHPDFPSCKCPSGKHWYNGQCRNCTNYTHQVATGGQGQLDTITGCSCIHLGTVLKTDGTGECKNCPNPPWIDPSNSSLYGKGLPHYLYTDCKCQEGDGWNYYSNSCINFSPDGCPIGSSKNGPGIELNQVRYPGCKCDNANGSIWKKDTCGACPEYSSGKNLTGESVSLIYDPPCRCTYGYDSITKKCTPPP